MIESDNMLERLNLPGDLKKLNYEQCDELARQMREVLIKTVSANGGHLASNLGTVELTIAIHRVFDSPKDKIIWDVGHQSYNHKLLTGRYQSFKTLRQENGLSGFCRPEESEHDAFISGHSSTSVSAALGYSYAFKLKGLNNYAVAVLGDGAATGGEFFEGLNNAGKSDTNIIVIINHNEMSISKNVGGLAKYLSTLRTKQQYIKTKGAVEKILDKTPVLGTPLKRTIKASKNTVKNMVLKNNMPTLFEDLGFKFVGPVDGHNVEEVEFALQAAKSIGGPVVVHVNTIKGKGYQPAEKNPGGYHGVNAFDLETGNPDVVPSDSFSAVFGEAVTRLASKNNKICAITAAMKYGTGLDKFARRFPKRFFDVGIAEQHAVTFAAGLSNAGMIPVFAVYSTFLQRGYDQLIHDLAITKTHAVIGVDRAGIVGEDGETHQGIFDISYLTSIPDITIYSPSNYSELRKCVDKAINSDSGLVCVRYPRGKDESKDTNEYVSTSFKTVKNGGKTLIITYGRLYNEVLKASEMLLADGIKTDILKLVQIFPIREQVFDIISQYETVYFFEESILNGSISQKLCSINSDIKAHAITDFVKQSSVSRALQSTGLSSDKIYETIKADFYENKA
ncbi:MAG: 1-deoxy-D-xylulose-5-phosphate synthase [Ruminococcus sp.]|nr:1-deoxy-D-xylulose-5-phosphate synthase [Ruminococcus sp.]